MNLPFQGTTPEITEDLLRYHHPQRICLFTVTRWSVESEAEMTTLGYEKVKSVSPAQLV